VGILRRPETDRVPFVFFFTLLALLLDYRETAAKFQKEWHIQEPHRQFDFAPHVKNHALVSVVNRGLLYYALEREFAQSQQVRSPWPSFLLSFFFFTVFCYRPLRLLFLFSLLPSISSSHHSSKSVSSIST
jgi:hypothetical protein